MTPREKLVEIAKQMRSYSEDCESENCPSCQFWFFCDDGNTPAVIADTIEDHLRRSTDTDKLVTEYCPECESEVEMRWDVEKDGYKAYCPVCGERLMLCDECQHRTGGERTEDCDYDGTTDTCRFNQKVNA